ncbi:MAG: DUF3299 domain-containing protein [bacterium]|jgi:hypothetical protein
MRLSLLLCGLLSGVLLASNAWAISIFSKPQELSWKDLRQLNYETGEMPSSLSKLRGAPVKIPGYAVPVEGDDGFDFVQEFLLVPVFGMCVHVPPPPPNQVVYVVMNEPVPIENLLDAVWISGVLEVDSIKVGGEMVYETEASFRLIGEAVELYDE